MPISKNQFLAAGAVLALGLGLMGPTPTVAQQDGSQVQETKQSAPPAEMPTAPPKNLKLVGDHWTPYSPPDPESFPADATLHIIVPGETLWGLADLSYSNPYLWPQLWNENRYITDSHWIYPGDPLLMPARPVVVTQAGGDEARPTVPGEIVPQGQEGAPPTTLEPMPVPIGENEPEAVEEPLAAEEPAPDMPAEPVAQSSSPRVATTTSQGHGRHQPQLVSESDVRCSGYIAEEGKRSDLFIAENDEAGYDNVTIQTLVYLNRGQDDPRIQPGAEFSIVEREGKVLHPVSDKSQGYFIKRLGELRVLKVMGDTAVAAVTFACDEIRVGNELVALEYQHVPSRELPPFDRLRMERNGKPVGLVIHTRDTAVGVATGDTLQIDLGSEDGLNPGDFLTAFEPIFQGKRPSLSDYHFKFNHEVYYRTDLHYDHKRDEYPAKPVGQLEVVSTNSHSATVKVVYSVSEVHIGTMVELD